LGLLSHPCEILQVMETRLPSQSGDRCKTPNPVRQLRVLTCTHQLNKVDNDFSYPGASILQGTGARVPNILLKGPCINRAPPIIKLQNVHPCQFVMKIMKCLYCSYCPKFGQFIMRKIIRIVATRWG